MYDNAKEFIKIMSKLEVNANQFLFLYLVFLKDKEITKMYREGYLKGTRLEAVTEFDIQYLIQKGYLEDHNLIDRDEAVKKRILENFAVTDDFISQVYLINSNQAAEELWAVYPSYLYINGERKPVGKAWDYNIFHKEYEDIVKNDLKTHKKILDDVRRIKNENGGCAYVKLENYIRSRAWEITDDVGESNERVRTKIH